MLTAPKGWDFVTADFSCLNTGRWDYGTIMFQRDKEGTAQWLELPSTKAGDHEHGQKLYAFGTGPTFHHDKDCQKPMHDWYERPRVVALFDKWFALKL